MDSNKPNSNGAQQGSSTETFDLNKPCRIIHVNFDGANRTRKNLLSKIVSDVFNSKSLVECLQTTLKAREKLESLRAFSSIDVKLQSVNEAEDDNIEVTFVLKERGIVTAAAQTALDDQAHLDLKLALPNISGRGQMVELISRFDGRLYSFEHKFSMPLMPWRDLFAPNYSLSLSKNHWTGLPTKLDQEDRLIVNQVDFFSLPDVQHIISFEGLWRSLKSSSDRFTPIRLREQSGQSLKTSIKHSVIWDTRVGGNFPYEGILAKLTNEIAHNIISGSSKFTRHDISLQFNTTVVPKYDVLCQFNAQAGTLFRPHKTTICDRFFAGGPLTMRAFKYCGIGPSVRDCPLGDTSYLAAGAHIYSILPFTSVESTINEYIRPHIFLNMGTIGDIFGSTRLGSREDIKRSVNRFRESLRYSCGFGLVMYFMKLRLEINYCIPLVTQTGDHGTRGVQWGFGLTYT